MRAVLLLVLASCVLPSLAQDQKPLPLDGFNDAIHHWYNRTGLVDAPVYPVSDTRSIANNILLYQRDNGGWPENTHPQRILSADEARLIEAEKNRPDASFDNRNIYPQISYLASAYQRTGDVRYREAALRGLLFTLNVQQASGGWPHSPGRADRPYAEHITFADEVMPGVLGFLRQVAKRQPPFDFVSDELALRSAEAVTKGDALVLQLQIRIDGKPTIWAGQYDKDTLQPVAARSYELPALQTWESVAVVDYLMAIPDPEPAVIEAVDAAVAWFLGHRIASVRIEEFAIEPVRFRYHTATIDRRLVNDPESPGLWARFYDLTSSEPFFTNHAGERVASLADVSLERRSGYHWYGTWPQELLQTAYPKWKAGLAQNQ